MNNLKFWQKKVVQLLHDPPGKPYGRYYRDKDGDLTGSKSGHGALAKRLMVDLGAQTDGLNEKGADLAASGADRPVLGHGGQLSVAWGHTGADPLATHPLCHAPLKLDGAKGETRLMMPKDSFEASRKAAESLKMAEGTWQDAKSLRQAHLKLWRRLRETLKENDESAPERALLWQWMPADTRCPDHSIWEHNRLSSALAFLPQAQDKVANVSPHLMPQLVSFSIGPVQNFIAESRTSRDLWTNSMLLADLSWSAMRVIVETYGPDAIVYPNLCANPMVDRFLADHPGDYPQALPEKSWLTGSDPQNPTTWSALLPHHFVALLPQGGGGDLPHFESILKEAEAAVQRRWQYHCQKIESVMDDALMDLGYGHHQKWQNRWKKQVQAVIHSHWASSPWRYDVDISHIVEGPALPAQQSEIQAQYQKAVAEAPKDRVENLGQWVPDDIWNHYENTRQTFAKTNAGYLKGERGFDYALTHHKLSLWHNFRKASRAYPTQDEAPANRCTTCQTRSALEPDDLKGHIDSRRQGLRAFWAKIGKAPRIHQPRFGEERLCAVCTTRRLLVSHGNPEDKADFNRIWTGEDYEGHIHSARHGLLKQPFPSTTAVACQRFLRRLASDPELKGQLNAIGAACKALDWPKTNYPASLASLQEFAHLDWLKYSPEWLFEGSRDATLRQLQGDDALMEDPRVEALNHAILDLLRRMRTPSDRVMTGAETSRVTAEKNIAEDIQQAIQKANPVAQPHRRFALVAMDGDGLGRLLLGDPEAIGVDWASVLHPLAVDAIQAGKLPDSGWSELLREKRLAGPSLQAFLSQCLAHFSHRIVPWVVEREFHGRLIYAGGDDVLAMVDEEDALALAARLQQLYASPWVLDTMPGASPFSHRGSGSAAQRFTFDPTRDRKRFVIPVPNADGRISLPVTHGGIPACSQWQGPGEQSTEVGHQTGAILAMPGPHQHLSAGIVFGHFKTSLRAAIKKAQYLLDETAKSKNDRDSLAMAVYTRGGVKAEAVIKWRVHTQSEGPSPYWPSGAALLQGIIEGFRMGQIPGRLPYKLKEMHWAFETLFSAMDDATATDASRRADEKRAFALIDHGADGKLPPKFQRDIYHLLRQSGQPDQGISSLLVCRALSQLLTKDEEGDA